jgi:hypothetical protein
MKVAKKSPRRIWLGRLVEREEQRPEREGFAEKLREQYTAAVTRETLALNEEFSLHCLPRD